MATLIINSTTHTNQKIQNAHDFPLSISGVVFTPNEATEHFEATNISTKNFSDELSSSDGLTIH